MSSTRTAPRSTTINKTTTASSNTHHTNGSGNSYDGGDSTGNTGNVSEVDSNLQRSVLTKNMSQSEGIYRNPRFLHAITTGLLGQPVIVQTFERERFHGVLETMSANGDVVLSVAHRLDNNNDIMGISTSLIDLFDTVDSSAQTFELTKRIVPSSNIIEIIASDIDLSGSGKCMLEEATKVTQLEDDRFNRMEHFYGADELDPDTFEDLEIGEDGKTGYDPEDMFHTNREKFNTTTDFDESKYTNVPIPEMNPEELAEIEKKASEIEKGVKNEDVDEDDAGVKRPSELNQTQNVDDGNSNTKNNQSSRAHPADRRSDFRYDAEYNPKRGSWREQRGGGVGGNNRRGGQNNYSISNQKPNQRSEQTQYTSSRSSEQSTNNRQQYKQRNNRFTDNRSPNEGRSSPSQAQADDTTRSQRINSGSFSQGQNSGPTSPSTTVPARTIYSTNNRPPIGRNSPAPYTGSSSSRNNPTTASATSPTTTTTTATSSYQTGSTGAGNYSQQSNNKMVKKQLRNEQQSTTDETDQPKPQRNQQQTPSNNQSNTGPLNRPSQLHTQQIRQQQPSQIPSSNNNVPTPLTLPPQEDHSSSHETINTNQSDQTMHITNASVYAQHATGTMTPGNAKANSGLNPEADEFVPVFSRESSSRPESRGASTNAMPLGAYVAHPHPQALHLYQQQQQQQQQQQVQQAQVQQQTMIPSTHPQNAAALYQHYYQPQYNNMASFVNAGPQQMNVNMMNAQMMPQQAQQPLSAGGPNTNNAGGMATPSAGSSQTYKTNNPVHGGDTSNTGVNNIAPKKAVVSVQRAEPSNVPQQQQQVAGAPQMVYQAPPIRYYQSEFMGQQATQQSMPLQQIPFYYPINTQGLIQATAATGVGPAQNIMIPSTSSSAGPGTPAPTSIFYPGMYPDPRLLGVYPSAASVNPGGVNPNWQLTRSPPHQQPQQQPTDQQRAYVGGQNVVPQQAGAQNASGAGAGRSASTSGPSGQTNPSSAGPSMTPQYALNGSIQATYGYGSPAAWYSTQAQVPSPQTNMPPQVNTYSMMFDPSQQVPSQQAAYVHANPYDNAYFQQSQQQLTQQSLDTVPPGNYNR